MAGFFDALLDLESNPEDRDYKRASEITSPEEMEAYRAGASATGIPGLDYARSLARAVGSEISEASMAPVGERFSAAMDEYRRRQEAANRLREEYPQAFRAGRLRGSESIPGAEMAFFAQPTMAGLARNFARRFAGATPEMAEREIAATPGGWESIDISRPERTAQPKVLRTQYPELSINPSRSISQEMHAGDVVPEAQTPAPAPAPAPRAYDPTRVVPESQETFWDLVESLPQKTREDLLRLHTTGARPSGFRMNAVKSALGKRDLSLLDFINESEGTMNPSVYSSHLRSRLTGQPMSPREQLMSEAHMRTFRPMQDADLEGQKIIRSPLSSGLNEPGLQFSDVSGAIEARRAADAAKAERIARMPEAVRRNIESAQANRIARGGQEAREFMTSRAGRGYPFRNVAPEEWVTQMGEASGYKPPEVVRRFWDKDTGLLQNRDNELLRKALAVSAGAAGGAGLVSMLNRDGGPESAPTPSPAAAPVSPDTGRRVLLPPIDIGSRMPKPKDDGIRKVSADRPAPRAPEAPARRTRPAPAPQRTRRAAPVSDQRYWGDWRDVEPYASDPIGNFIDALTGDVRSSRKRGSVNRSRGFDLSNLLPFADGGSVRQHFVDGGSAEEDRIPILSDIGDLIGGLVGGGGDSVVARDQDAPRGSDTSGGIGGLDLNELSQFLMAAGFGMMASPSHYPLESIGRGGLMGLEYMNAARAENERRRKEMREASELERERRAMEKIGLPPEEQAPIETAAITSEEPEKAHAPEKVKISAAPEAPAEAVAPKAPLAETPLAPPVKIAETAPEVSAPSAETEKVPSVVSADRKTPSILDTSSQKIEQMSSRANQLIKLHNQLSSVSVMNPQLRADKANRLHGLEFEINRLNSQIQQEKQNALNLVKERREEKKAEKEAFKESPEGQIQEARGKEQAAHFVANEKEQDSTQKQFTLLDQMQHLVDDGMYAGPVQHFASTMVAANPYASEEAQKYSENTKVFDMLAGQLIFAKLDGKLNAGTSNNDLAFVTSMYPSSSMSVNQIRKSIDMMRKLADRRLEIIQMENAYVQKHGKLDDNFRRALKQWGDEHPLFPEAPGWKGKDQAPQKTSTAPDLKSVMEKSGRSEKELREMFERMKKERP